MAELCHVCDLFRVALFGPSNNGNEDHLDDALGNDLPRPMADAPATMGVRPRSRPATTALTAVAKTNPVSQPSGVGGATATPSISSEPANGSRAAAREAVGAPVGAVAAAAARLEPVAAATAAPAAKPTPKTKFSKRATRGLKAAPAYMSFDDVEIEDDDSDGELFVDDPGRWSRSPGSVAAHAKSTTAYTADAPSVYRAPSLAPPRAAAPPAPSANSKASAEAFAQAISVAGDEEGGKEEDERHGPPSAGGGVGHDSLSSQRALAGDSSQEELGAGFKGGGLQLSGGRVASIPRNGSTLESARPHGQSESYHGYKGYPGYEPDTPVAQQLTQPGRQESGDSLTINAGADVSDPRQRYAPAAAPTPSSVDYPNRNYAGDVSRSMTLTPTGRQDEAGGITLDSSYAEDLQQQQYRQQQEEDLYQQQQGQQMQKRYEQHRQEQQRVISPSATTSMEMATGIRPPEPRGRGGQVEVATRHERDTGGSGHSAAGGVGLPPSGSTGRLYGSEAGESRSAYGGGGGDGDNGSAYGGGGGASSYGGGGVSSPAHSHANSMTSSYRNIPQVPSEDGMGSVLGTLAGTEDSANEDLQWKRSALKKFHKVMVKGEGLRVVKHNRSGGSQMRIIRYDPEMKALVWNSKRYMKKAGSANVPIVGIKRVGREGNTVSVTAAGRGTIGFEPQRIRDAKILEEALRALVDKEERSAMWRG